MSRCFFSGRVSAHLDSKDGYFVDGVAINGVSGGPAFHYEPDGSLVLTGLLSAYMPNKAPGVPLPGLAVVKHVGQLQKVVRELQGLDDGIERQRLPPELPALDEPITEA